VTAILEYLDARPIACAEITFRVRFLKLHLKPAHNVGEIMVIMIYNERSFNVIYM